MQVRLAIITKIIDAEILGHFCVFVFWESLFKHCSDGMDFIVWLIQHRNCIFYKVNWYPVSVEVQYLALVVMQFKNLDSTNGLEPEYLCINYD